MDDVVSRKQILNFFVFRKQLQGITGLSASSAKFDGHFDVSMRITNITRLSGDAVIHLRKGRMWPLCDLQLLLSVEVRWNLGGCYRSPWLNLVFAG